MALRGEDMKTVGRRIKRLREENEWTQIELAKRASINNSVMSRIEAGIRPVEDDLIVRFAKIFNTSTDYLLGRTENRKVSDPALDSELNQIMRDLGPDVTLQFYDLKGMSDDEKENLIIFLQGLKARREQKKEK